MDRCPFEKRMKKRNYMASVYNLQQSVVFKQYNDNYDLKIYFLTSIAGNKVSTYNLGLCGHFGAVLVRNVRRNHTAKLSEVRAILCDNAKH